MAALLALESAAQRASPVLLEPIKSVVVLTPDRFASAIVSDLNSRRGSEVTIQNKAGTQVIRATVPLAEMFGYAKHLYSKSAMQAEVHMQLSHYAETLFGGLGDDNAGIIANKPQGPKPERDSASADPQYE